MSEFDIAGVDIGNVSPSLCLVAYNPSEHIELTISSFEIDWEHVGKLNEAPVPRPFTDADGYLQMLKALRAALPLAELSAAVGMNLFRKARSPTDDTLENVDMHPFVPLFDRIYLMTYDLWYGEETAGSNGALKPDGKYPVVEDQGFGAQGVQAWHDAGFPMSKLVYGTLTSRTASKNDFVRLIWLFQVFLFTVMVTIWQKCVHDDLHLKKYCVLTHQL